MYLPPRYSQIFYLLPHLHECFHFGKTFSNLCLTPSSSPYPCSTFLHSSLSHPITIDFNCLLFFSLSKLKFPKLGVSAFLHPQSLAYGRPSHSDLCGMNKSLDTWTKLSTNWDRKHSPKLHSPIHEWSIL